MQVPTGNLDPFLGMRALSKFYESIFLAKITLFAEADEGRRHSRQERAKPVLETVETYGKSAEGTEISKKLESDIRIPWLSESEPSPNHGSPTV